MKEIFILYIIFSLFLVSCNKNPEPVEESFPPATPYTLEITPRLNKDFTIPADNPLTVEGVFLGRKLFYDRMLSKGNEISCASCHQQALAFTDGKKVSEGVQGRLGKRSAMSLGNLLWNKAFFWDGRSLSLEDQALKPIQDHLEMDLSLPELISKLESNPEYPTLFGKAFGTKEINPSRIAKALAQFQRTLVTQDSKYDRYKRGEASFTAQEINGMNLFFTHPIPGVIRGANCGDCHAGDLTTALNDIFEDNGLDIFPLDSGRAKVTGQSYDVGKFKVPSLRNIALTGPYMHDGRFLTLSEVIEHYDAHLQASPNLSPLLTNASNLEGGTSLLLTTQEKADVLAFLHTLTDSTFINNPKFQKP